MSAHSDEVRELAAKILPGMRERAQIYFQEMLNAAQARGEKGLPATVVVEVILKTMADEFACAIIGMRP